MKTLAVVCCALVTLSAIPVAAQTPGQPPRSTPTINPNVRYGSSAAENQNRLAGRLIEDGRDGRSDEEIEREALLERIAPMVAEGRCNAARAAAREAGDRAVSRRVGQVCVEGRPTPMEAPAQ